MQPLDLVERHVGAGRVVGVGEEDDLGPRASRGEDRVDIGGLVGLLGATTGTAPAAWM